MIYSKEVEEMCPVAKGVDHGPAPIPEEGKWVKSKEIKDISGLTHGKNTEKNKKKSRKPKKKRRKKQQRKRTMVSPVREHSRREITILRNEMMIRILSMERILMMRQSN